MGWSEQAVSVCSPVVQAGSASGTELFCRLKESLSAMRTEKRRSGSPFGFAVALFVAFA